VGNRTPVRDTATANICGGYTVHNQYFLPLLPHDYISLNHLLSGVECCRKEVNPNSRRSGNTENYSWLEIRATRPIDSHGDQASSCSIKINNGITNAARFCSKRKEKEKETQTHTLAGNRTLSARNLWNKLGHPVGRCTIYHQCLPHSPHPSISMAA